MEAWVVLIGCTIALALVALIIQWPFAALVVSAFTVAACIWWRPE